MSLRPYRHTNPRKVAPELTPAQLVRELSRTSDRLADYYKRLPMGIPVDVSLHIAGAFKFLGMAVNEIQTDLAKQWRATEQSLESASPILRQANTLGFTGFGGECFAAAIAMNRVLFNGKLTYSLAVNEAFHEKGRTIGHATLLALDAKGNRRHFDADGRLKVDEDVETWGMLDTEDAEFEEIAKDLGIEWSYEVANKVAFIEVSERDLLALVKDGQVATLEALLRQAAEDLDHALGCPAP